MSEIKIYQVGGSVRDELLGVTSKDLDFAVEAPSFEAMKKYIEDNGGDIFQEKPEFLTIRARMPKVGPSDYVLCRKEGKYSDGRRPDSTEPGTILDDLSRRDFTMNAIAKCPDGTLYDPFGGQEDIMNRLIRCVGSTLERFTEDSLRILRAIRFSITKDFDLDDEILSILDIDCVLNKLNSVSPDRIREELHKCFAHDTIATLWFFERFQHLKYVVFNKMWLKPTTEET